MRREGIILLLLMIISASFALTDTIDVSTATGTGSGTLPGDIQADDDIYYNIPNLDIEKIINEYKIKNN